MRNALEVCDLVKHYPGVAAVDGLSFAVAPGVTFGNKNECNLFTHPKAGTLNR